MSAKDSIKIQEGVPKVRACLIGILMIILLLLALIFIALYSGVTGIGSSGELNDVKNENIKKDAQIKQLNDSVIATNTSIQSLKKEVISLNATMYVLKGNITTLNKTAAEQLVQLTSLKSLNLYLWAGTGVSAALAVGGGIFASTQFSAYNQVNTYYNQNLTNYTNYRNYFSESALWMVEDFMIYYMAKRVAFDTVFNTTENWDKTRLINSLVGIERTATHITTDKGWVIAGVLSKAWATAGNYVDDPKAFVMSVNRVAEGIIPPTKPTNSQKAARIPSNADGFLEFGDGEIKIFQNKIGIARANVTYWNYDSTVPRDLFYAGELRFNVTRILIQNYSFSENKLTR